MIQKQLQRKLYCFTIFFVTCLWIHYAFCVFTMNFLFFSRNHYKFTFFENSLYIHYLFREFIMYLLSFSWIHFEFTIFFVEWQWIHYLLCKFTQISLFFFANSSSIYSRFRGFTLNSLSFSRNHNGSLIFFREFHYYFSKSLWIHN